MVSPDALALRSSADKDILLPSFAATTRGGVSGVSSGDSEVPSTSSAFHRRCSRSVGRRGNHSATIRRPLFEETIVTTPLQDPMSRAAMAVAHEICFEDRFAPILVIWMRARRAHKPARFGGTRIQLCAEAQKKNRAALLGRGQCQATACDEIENLWLSDRLDNDSSECRRRKRIFCRAHRIGRIADGEDENARRICPKFNQAGRSNLAMFDRGKILPYP
ncbi:MAG TPA: hypothetical protein VGO84_15620 [Burkholderiales bacterium]|nr:hypothetical protein [Burkholderiales bacterium]